MTEKILDLVGSSTLRFLVCGGLAAAINWLARFAFSTTLPFEAAVIAAYAVGMLAGFVLYRTLVWPEGNLPLASQVGRFIVVNLVGAVIVFAATLATLAVLGRLFGISPVTEGLGHGFGIAVGAFANYAGHARFTFRRRATLSRNA